MMRCDYDDYDADILSSIFPDIDTASIVQEMNMMAGYDASIRLKVPEKSYERLVELIMIDNPILTRRNWKTIVSYFNTLKNHHNNLEPEVNVRRTTPKKTAEKFMNQQEAASRDALLEEKLFNEYLNEHVDEEFQEWVKKRK